MAWLEFTIETTPQSIDSAVTATKAKDDWRCVTAIRKYI